MFDTLFYFPFPTVINLPPLAQRILIWKNASSGLAESDFLLLSCWAHSLAGSWIPSRCSTDLKRKAVFRACSVLRQRDPAVTLLSADGLGDAGGLSLTPSAADSGSKTSMALQGTAVLCGFLLLCDLMAAPGTRSGQSCPHPVPQFTLS